MLKGRSRDAAASFFGALYILAMTVLERLGYLSYGLGPMILTYCSLLAVVYGPYAPTPTTRVGLYLIGVLVLPWVVLVASARTVRSSTEALKASTEATIQTARASLARLRAEHDRDLSDRKSVRLEATVLAIQEIRREYHQRQKRGDVTLSNRETLGRVFEIVGKV